MGARSVNRMFNDMSGLLSVSANVRRPNRIVSDKREAFTRE
jgi:hypothetical protein